MIGRSQEANTLLLRLAATQSGPRDAAIDEEASRAVEQWSLLSLLTHGVPSAARPVSLRGELAQPSPSLARQPAVPFEPLFPPIERAAVSRRDTRSPPHHAAMPPAPPSPVVPRPDAAVAIEPREVLHYDRDASPTRLFERMKR